MISRDSMNLSLSGSFKEKHLGATGYLAIFFSSIAAVMITPALRLPWAAGGCLLVAWLVYPQAFRSLTRLRWLVMIGLLALPPIFLVGEVDRSLFGISYSAEGLLNGIQIALRILVILISVQGLTSLVDISSIAGLLERAGLHGLGFSLGVALNLLPALQQSAQNAWRSLWMRGGLRKQRWRALRLLAVTIIVNALSRAEEIALAAEVRAFSPERTRSMPVKVGKWDWGILILGVLLILGLVLIS
jgi:energy-coupling factor transporter transmembrane protein EcfT